MNVPEPVSTGKLPPELHDQLKAKATELRISMAAALRQAVQLYLDTDAGRAINPKEDLRDEVLRVLREKGLIN